MRKLGLFIVTIVLITSLIGCNSAQVNSKNYGEVNVYTTRHYDADDALYEKFTAETGIKVNVVTDKAVVSVEKIKEQGDAVQADVYMTSDAGNLANAKSEGILDTVSSEILETNIPSKYQDIDNTWFGLTKRARVFLYSKERVTDDELNSLTYDSLVTDTRWEDKVLVRPSSNIYNQSLVASFIETVGEENATEWVKNLTLQMARNPEGNDREQAVEVKNGVGDVAIANSYYYGKLVNEKDTESKYYGVADVVGIYFPDQGDDQGGVHVNISGAGVVKNASNKDNAIKLIEFLSEIKQQEAFSATNYEFPVNSEAKTSELLQSWLDEQGITQLKEQPINLSVLGEHNAKAYEVMTTVGWDSPK